ncbi:hypothetical protein MJO28_000857 [Puccinia striiformis f. sp. tritici]|uniref:Uncharacterized protein n=1 Tax=Puccinia striiformis f. sp. tritici TaxID=168172 RepID=A0ACC0F0T6_9BASI|nr:hypothetical protein MJO28_000857 [Puccinia striiformis f. sp. tritici]
MNNCNATSLFTCEAFGEHITSLLKRTLAPLERALAQADMSKIETVELIGGLNRVPALKCHVQEFLGNPLSFTCNWDKDVTRGETPACSVLSLIFEVREFAVTDIVNFAINTAWQPIYGDSSTTLKTSIPESHSFATLILANEEVQIEATPAEGGEEAKPTKKMVKREGAFTPFLTREVKQQLLDALSQAEEWLYCKERMLASRNTYSAKDQPRAGQQLREMISSHMQKAHGGNPMYAQYISEKHIQTAIEKCAAAEK